MKQNALQEMLENQIIFELLETNNDYKLVATRYELSEHDVKLIQKKHETNN